ncbi:hypothetical protein D9M71_526040 [compost metagenome]
MHHCINIPLQGSDQGPVGTDTVAVQLQVANRAVLDALGIALDVAVQAAVADVKADMLAVAAFADLRVEVLPDLEAVEIAIQARAYRAGPALVKVIAICLAPTG